MLDHVSIQADDLAGALAFYDTVLAPLGGRRVPYYRAFVRDPGGNNVEAVCHVPPGQA